MSLVGIDLGTGSVKVLVVDAEGRSSSASEGYSVTSPASGYAETDPAEWIKSIRACVRRLGGASGTEVIGLSGQMHGVVPVSLSKGALGPAILWADQRGVEVLPRLEALPKTFQHRVRNSWTAGMAITSILWLREKQPQVYQDADFFLLPKDYVRWVLTGVVGTEPSDACGTLMYDLDTASWMVDLLDVLGLDAAKLPPIGPSHALVGVVTAGGSQATGLPVGASVVAGAGDTPAALFGSNLPVDHAVQISIGTGTQVVRQLRTLPSYHPALNVFQTVRPGVFFQMAGMLNGGLALEWVRSVTGQTWDQFYSSLDGASPPWDLQFLPYLTGERTPYLNPLARGVWAGLGLHHSPRDLLHSALLGVACSVRLGLDTLNADGCTTFRVVGGSSRFAPWNQLLADVLGKPLDVSNLTDASSWGAVRLASEALGRPLEIPATFRRFEPRPSPEAEGYYRGFLDLYRRLYPAS